MDLFTTDWKKCYEVVGIDVSQGIPTNVPPPLSCVFTVLQNIINAALVLAAVVAVILIMYAGYQFVTSNGDKEKVDGARKRITYAIIGLIVIIFAFAIINLISQVTGVPTEQFGVGNN